MRTSSQRSVPSKIATIHDKPGRQNGTLRAGGPRAGEIGGEAPATPAKASPPGPSARHYELPREDFPKQVYQASGVRKTILSLIFLLLLPFFISLPAMLYQRLTNQLWTDTIGFTIFASAFIIVMVLLVFELVHSIRSRVEINDKALKFTLL